MSNVNRGKQFEDVFKAAVERVPDTAIVRLHDQTTGYYGSKNPCDFLIYHAPYMYAIECKSVHGNTLPLRNITDFQRTELVKMGNVNGVVAGVVCWWIDKDVTLFIPIQTIQQCYDDGWKSINYQKALTMQDCIVLYGNKKRIFFDYNMNDFFKICPREQL